MSMSRIIVIGNGFDIDLGWRTSYKDFFYSKIEGWRRCYHEKDELMYYIMNHAGENWYDLERTLYEYCLTKSKEGSASDDLMERDLRHYESLKSQLVNFVNERSKEPVREGSQAYSLLQKYIEDTNRALPKDIEPRLFSFNYTPLSLVAKQINPNAKFSYTPVHGTIEKKNCVFGFHDDVQIKGQYRKMQKSMTNEIDSHELIRPMMDAREIVFFGMSMGYIDGEYFKRVFELLSEPGDFKNRKVATVTFYTKDADSKLDIKLNLQDIGINVQRWMQNNKVIFKLASEGYK